MVKPAAPTKKRKSGGARRTEAKRRAKAAAFRRPLGYSDDWLARYRALGPAPIGNPVKAHQWVADLEMLAVEEAANDPGLPPEQRREQVGRLAAHAVKVLDPAKLALKLAELERALEEAQDARQVTS
jgi:hypothetical protein